MISVHIALLRGVNVGGKNRVGMAELRSLLARQGFDDVRTYVQSGNAVFGSRSGSARELARDLEREIAAVFGIDVTVVLRTRAQFDKVVNGNPFVESGADRAKLHVAFLDRKPKPAASAVAELDAHRSPPDAFSVRGREIYLHLPGGAGRTKLTIAYFERQLAVRATARNWKTVTTLQAMARELT